MGCTAKASYSYRKTPQIQEKGLPTTMQSGSEIITIKTTTNGTTIKSQREQLGNDAPTAKVIEKALLPKDIDFILLVLHKHFLFRNLDYEIKSQTIRSMKYFKLKPKEVIFKQGDFGRYLFILVKGEVDIQVNDLSVKKVEKGGMLGEIAIMHNATRTASAYAINNVELWGLERDLFKKALKTLALKQYHENKLLLERCELFSYLDPLIRNKLLEVLATQVFTNSIIIREGEPGDNVYIVKSGRVKLSIDGEYVKDLGEGGYFGEQSLLNESIRTATVTAIDTAVLICLGHFDLERVLGSTYLKIIYQNCERISIERDQFLSRLTRYQAQQLINAAELHKYKDKEVIIKKNKSVKKVSFILKGKVLKDNLELDKYSCLGSSIMADIDSFDTDFIASGPVECAEISKSKIEELLKGNFAQITHQNNLIQILSNLPLLSSLNEDILRDISKSTRAQKFEDGEIICSQGTCGTELYLIHIGEVDIIIDGNYVRTLIKGSYFGERALLFSEPRSATVISKGQSQIFILTREVFDSVVDSHIREQMLSRIYLQDYSVKLKDLSIIKTIGKGMFGSVFLAVHRVNKFLYAIKTITRNDIKRLKIKKNIRQSQEVLLQIDCPLIMKLIKTLSDKERVYFLLEYVSGVTLYHVIQEIRPFPHTQLMFYTANIILILKHLHSRDLAHRDLKPENIIVDKQGYLKLVDFDTACKIKDRAYTIAGTPHYMAPEMLKGYGYGVSVDYWSLGVILYEMIYDFLPFGEYTDEPLEIYQSILDCQVEYRNKHKNYQKLIQMLLEPNPGLRADYTKLMSCEYFIDLKWDSILHKKIVPGYIPSLSKVSEKTDNLSEFSVKLIEEEERLRIKEINN